MAVSAVLAVVEPYSSGIGGGGFCLLHRASDKHDVMLDGREKAPLAAHRDMYLDDQGDIINTIQYDDVGIILRVTPFISNDGLVEMIIAPEISSISEETVILTGTAEAPVINKRSAETVVVTSHGQTVVIGGLIFATTLTLLLTPVCLMIAARISARIKNRKQRKREARTVQTV